MFEDIVVGLFEKLLKIFVLVSWVECEGWLVCKDMICYWVVVIIIVIYDNSGKLLGYVKIICDMSE